MNIFIKVRLWDANQRACIRTFYDHTGPVNDVCFHPDGLCVAACSSDNTIKICTCVCVCVCVCVSCVYTSIQIHKDVCDTYVYAYVCVYIFVYI